MLGAILLPFLWLLTVTMATHEYQPPYYSIKKDPDTSLILFGMRHANRNPENFVNPIDHTWGNEGALELTKFGKQQACGLGRELRKFVGFEYLNENYLPKEAVFYSSSAARCQMSLQAATAGLYTPNGWADWDRHSFDNWSPIPYTIDDPLLRMYAVSNCPNSDSAWEPISNDKTPELSKMASEKRDLLNYMAQNTGWKPEVSKGADLADNIINIKLYNARYPQFLEHPTLRGYTKETIIDAYLEFAEAHQNACALDQTCGHMMGGYWLKHILDSLKKAAKGESPKIIGYASHTEVTLSVMKLMGYARNEITTSAGFAIEFKKTPVPSVRLLDHDPNKIEVHVIYKAALVPELEGVQDSNGFIPLSEFERYVSSKQITDWEAACGRKKCN